MQLKCSSSINVLTRAVHCHHDRYWFYRDSPPVLVYYVHVLPSSVQTPYSDKTLVFCIVQIQSHCVVRSSSSFCFPCFKQNPHRLNSVSVLCLNLEKLCDFSLKKTKNKKKAGWWLVVHRYFSLLHNQHPAGLESVWKRLRESSICQAG